MDERTGYTLTEAADRYRQTLVFNNDLLKRNFAERYEFNTQMQVTKRRDFGASADQIIKYEERRTREYDKKFKAYSARLDGLVEISVHRYMHSLRTAFGYD